MIEPVEEEPIPEDEASEVPPKKSEKSEHFVSTVKQMVCTLLVILKNYMIFVGKIREQQSGR